MEKQLKILNKPEALVEIFHKYRKTKLYSDFMLTHGLEQDQKSPIFAFVHGDCWTNNFFVNEDYTKVNICLFFIAA